MIPASDNNLSRSDSSEQQAEALDINLGTAAFLKNLSKSYLTATDNRDANNLAEQAEPPSRSYQLADGMAASPCDGAFNSRERIMGGVQEIAQTMMDGFNLDDVVSMSLEVLYRSLEFHRALMFVRKAEGRRMTVQFGYGHDAATLVGALGFDMGSQKDVFNLSIRVGKDLIVADAADTKIKHLIPDWYGRHLNAPAFIFLPVTFKKACIGALYADRDHNGAPISDTEHQHLSLLRNQLLLAIKFQRQPHRDGFEIRTGFL